MPTGSGVSGLQLEGADIAVVRGRLITGFSSGSYMDVLVVATPLRVLCEIALSSVWNISTTLNAWQFCLAKIRQDSLGFTTVIGHTARLRMKASGKRLFLR